MLALNGEVLQHSGGQRIYRFASRMKPQALEVTGEFGVF